MTSNSPDIKLKETPVRAPSHVPVDDAVLPFEVASLDLRGRLTRLGPGLDDLLAKQQYVIACLSPLVQAYCFMREDPMSPSARTVQVDASQGPGPSGGGRFWAASSDGSKVFFTDEEQLTNDSKRRSANPISMSTKSKTIIWST